MIGKFSLSNWNLLINRYWDGDGDGLRRDQMIALWPMGMQLNVDNISMTSWIIWASSTHPYGNHLIEFYGEMMEIWSECFALFISI